MLSSTTLYVCCAASQESVPFAAEPLIRYAPEWDSCQWVGSPQERQQEATEASWGCLMKGSWRQQLTAGLLQEWQ